MQDLCSVPFIPVDVRRLIKPDGPKGMKEGDQAHQELAAVF